MDMNPSKTYVRKIKTKCQGKIEQLNICPELDFGGTCWAPSVESHVDFPETAPEGRPVARLHSEASWLPLAGAVSGTPSGSKG